MANLYCEIFSKSLDMASSFVAILPEDRELSECPVVYLLHGLSDNCTGWSRYTAIERYAREKGAAVIMPEVQRSFYTDMEMGLAYFSYISEELPQICHRMFGLSRKREKNFVMGLSMGGYGALKCALTQPQNYAGCASFSAVTDIQKRVETSEGIRRREFQAMFGTELTVPPSAKLEVLLSRQSGKDLPPFFMTCGEQDSLYPDSCRFAEMLKEAGRDVEFRSFPGDHTWDFWDMSVKMALDYFLNKQ